MNRDIMVVGGSAGAVEAVLQLVRHLPKDLPAAVFVVIHTSPNGHGELAGLIHRAGPLAGVMATDGEEIRPGHIYVARADHHLLVERGRIRVVRGPRENRNRPAIDPLFRSAAVAYGPRVIGVILSGTLDDGSAGLAKVRALGGRVVAQDPEEARFGDMPRNAMLATEMDAVLGVKEMAAILSGMSREEVEENMEASESDRLEAGIAANDLVGEGRMREVADPSVFICPDCGGDLFQYKDREMLRFRCSIGHALSARTLLDSQSGKVEEALAASFRSLVEHQRLYQRMREEFTRLGMRSSVAGMERKEKEVQEHAAVIQGLLMSLSQDDGDGDGDGEGTETAAGSEAEVGAEAGRRG